MTHDLEHTSSASMLSPRQPSVSNSHQNTTYQVSEILRQCVTEVQRAYLSDAPHIELIFIALLAQGHVLLEGVPGVAKTTLARSVSVVCGCPMKRIQFTPDLLPTDILGGAVFNPQTGEFEVRHGPIFTHFLLADELNRAPAKTQSALLEAMQEAQVTLEGQSIILPMPFFTLATQNPIEQVGVYSLPEAQLDRFALKIEVGYPTESAEVQMLHTYQQHPPELTPLLNAQQICDFQKTAENIFVHPDIFQYIVKISRATRTDPRSLLGVSPRASLMLTKLSKARALFYGRAFVSPDDVQEIAPYTLSHRVRLQPDAEYEGVQPSSIVESALKSIPYHGQYEPRRST